MHVSIYTYRHTFEWISGGILLKYELLPFPNCTLEPACFFGSAVDRSG